MEKYKKRSFGFSNVVESRELRAKRKSVDRANIKNQRLSILRQIDENLEQDASDEKSVSPKIVDEKPKPLSRLEMLKKWKEEKELKKKIEASKKNPVFKVSKVSHGLTPAFLLPSKTVDFRIKGNLSFSAKPTPLKTYNQRSTAFAQSNTSVSIKSNPVKTPYQPSSSVAQTNNCRSIPTRSKLLNQNSSTVKQMNNSRSTHSKITNHHSSAIKQPATRVQPTPVVGKDIPPIGVTTRKGSKLPQKNNNLNIPAQKEGTKSNIQKGVGISLECSSLNPKFGSSKDALQKNSIQRKGNNSKSSNEEKSGSRPSFAPANFVFKAPAKVKSLNLPAKGIAAMFAEIFEMPFPGSSEPSPTETMPKVTVEELVTCPKKSSPPPEFEIKKEERKLVNAVRPLQTISENAELSGTVAEQALCDTPVKCLAKGLHGLKVDSPSVQNQGESEVKRPLTRLQQRISLLGTPELPQTRARRSIRGDLIAFSPIA